MTLTVAEISLKLRQLQWERATLIKSRIKIANRLQSVIAGQLGYTSGMEESERKALYAQAGEIIEAIAPTLPGGGDPGYAAIIRATSLGTEALLERQGDVEKIMLPLAKQLPVAAWVREKAQDGFGMLSLATVIGETGDLALYSNPGKVWRRLGCAPFESDGKRLMGATWRAGKEGKLSAAEWSEFGYSPRRRSVAYLLGEGIVKLNGGGPYRARYDEAKAKAVANHPEWTRCEKCDGTGRTKGKRSACSNCKGTGKVMKRCHLHAMLLATKLLLKNLWIEWNKDSMGGKSVAYSQAG